MYWSALDSVGKALTVNEFSLAARKAIGNGKYQCKKNQEKRGRLLLRGILSKPKNHWFKNYFNT